MSIEKTISSFIPQQFPSFYKEEGPNFIAFVKAYYEWLESTGQTLNRARSLLEYSDIDKTEEEFIQYFKSKYLNSIPSDLLADKRLLVKHILDLYRAKGTPRSYELLFRLLFNEEIELYIPGDYLLKPSDGEWVTPRYIEVSDSEHLEKLIGKQIYNSSKTAKAIVENVNRKIINNRIVHILYLSSLSGRFKYNEKILSAEVPELTLDNSPTVLGSLTAIALDNGGSGFGVGDVVDIYGGGIEAKARIAAVRDESGKVQFNLLDGGSGYSVNAIVTIATAQYLSISNTVGIFSPGESIKSTSTDANGTITFANSSYIQMINFSQNLKFNSGDIVTNSNGATASVLNVTGGGGAGATFSIGGLVNKEILYVNTDKISNYLSANLSLTWSFPKNPVANLNSTIDETLTFRSIETGKIAFLSSINPGDGYSAIPYISVLEPDVAAENFPDGFGGYKGQNAIVTAKVANSSGVATAAEVYNSGYGFNPGETIFVSSNTNPGVVATGVSVIDTEGSGEGYWKNNKGFLSDIIKIQDSYYYQDFSYEILTNRMLNVYEKIVKDLVHPSGLALFGRYRIKQILDADKSELKSVNVSQTSSSPLFDSDFTSSFDYSSGLNFTRASNARFFDTNYNLQQANVNIPRIARDPESGISGWLLEPARTNTIRNPSCLGANLITGAAPTNWLYANGTGSNLSFVTTGVGTENNIPYVDVRLIGRPTSNVSPLIRADQVYSSAVYTQLWTHSLYLKLVGGSLNGIDTPRLTISEWAANGSFLQQQSSIITIPEATARFSDSKKIASVALANTSTATVGSQFSVLCYENQDIDATFRIGAPQLERGTAAGATNPLQTFDTSPILNLTSTSSTITRASENVSMPLNIGSEFTIFCEYMYRRHIPGVGGTTLIQVRLDDSTTSNMLQLLSRSVGVPVVRGALTGGGVGAGTPDQLYTLGTIAKQAITYSSGTAFYSYNGISPLILTGTFTQPLNRLLVAANAPSYVRRITVWGRRMSNTELQSLTTL